MSFPAYWPSVTPGSYDPQQFVQFSQAGTTGVATTTVYSPLANQQATVRVPQQQAQVVQPIYPQQRSMPSTYSSSQLLQSGGQGLYPFLQGQQVLEVVQTGPMTNQPQAAHNQMRAQPVMVSSLQASQPALPLQCSTAQTNHPTQLWVAQPGILQQRSFNNPNFVRTENIPDHLAGHEPCIQTLTFLESQIECQKQTEKRQSDQLRIMWEKSNQQEKKLDRLKVECRLKDLTIGDLKSRIDPRKSRETVKVEIPRLRAVITEQRDELERLQQGSDAGVIDTNTAKGRRCGRRSYKSPDIPVKRSSDNVSSLSETVDSYQDELSRLQQENQAFRLVIGRLERENSEISKLRVEVLQLGIKLREVKPLQNKTTLPTL